LIGSGEVAPGMVGLHRRLLDALDGDPSPVFVDTPAGFELGLETIHERFQAYFDKSLGLPLTIASYRRRDADPSTTGAALDSLRRSRYILAGPGSPSYAIEHWRRSPVFQTMIQCWQEGASLVFASSAAVAIGRLALPVYEIYKVGQDPHWIEGLDLLSLYGYPLAIVPHWDNAEGGTHDTSACFMGMSRFRGLQQALPPEIPILGIDEHTALILSLDDDTGEVLGRGGVTVITRAGEHRFDAGAGLKPSRDLLAPAQAAAAPARLKVARSDTAGDGDRTLDPELQAATEIAGGEVAAGLRTLAAVGELSSRSILDLAAEKVDSMVLQTEDPEALLDLLMAARQTLRQTQQWQAADAMRQALSAMGIEVRDTPDGSTWERHS
jgi:hypothetical protein